MKKIIFLDIDGVFNCNDWYEKRTNKQRKNYPLGEFDPDRVNLFNQIIDKTNAQIVVSSTWRSDGKEAMIDLFNSVGIKGNIIDVTPSMKHLGTCIYRGNEIQYWIEKNLKYPWLGDLTKKEEYSVRNKDGSFRFMKNSAQGIDYQYVIIDDDSDMLYWQRNNFCKTDWLNGLQQEHVDFCIKILNS